ncbi:MAG: alpha/beta fold hydrolase [Lishizhenia sp.]
MKKAAQLTVEIFQKTARKTIRDRERSFYTKYFKSEQKDSCGTFTIIQNFNSLEIENDELHILVHGWNSNLSSLSEIADKLDKEGKYFFAFNLPGHGDDNLSKSNVILAKERLKFILKQFKRVKRINLISHSFGSSVVSFALSELNIKVVKLVFLTSPNSLLELFYAFGNLLHLKQETLSYAAVIGSKLLSESSKEANVSNKLASAKFDTLLIIHDEKDLIIPIKTAFEIKNQIENVKLSVYRDIGHYRMLSNPSVVNEVAEFMRQ